MNSKIMFSATLETKGILPVEREIHPLYDNKFLNPIFYQNLTFQNGTY